MAQDVSQLSDAQLLALIGPQQARAPAATRASQPRGIRNNNPGNIEDGPFARSLPGYAGSDGRFARFSDPDAGSQAAPRLLQSYLSRGFDTPASIINRWAPPSDNNPTSQYADYVARRVGVGVNDRVSPEQIPLIAQAISEFENGNTVDVGSTAQFTSAPMGGVEALSDDDLLALVGSEPQESPQPVEVEVSGGVVNRNGRAILVDPSGTEQDMGPFARYVADRERKAEERRALAERRANPQYQQEYEAALGRSENVPALLENLLQGASLGGVPMLEGALGWLDPNVEGIDRGLASQAARDASRDRQARLMSEDPLGTFGAQLVGGLVTPGLNASGAYISGATGAARGVRAAQVGAGYGAASGLIGGRGDVGERLDDAVVGGLVGAGAGAVGQRVADRLTPAARAAARPSNARVLSREGVDLTPGMMFGEVPLVGPVIRNLEEGASSIPFIGQPIAGARQQSVETFNRAAINRALSPINERLPRGMNAGYQAVEEAQSRLGRAYDEVLPRVSARIDDQFDDDLSALSARAQTDLTPPLAQQFDNIVQQRIFRNIPGDDVIAGSDFKRIESEVGALAREYRTASDPQNRALSRLLDDSQDIVRELVARQNPQEAQRIRDINRGYANLVRIENAAGSSASQATEGVFSPTQLGLAAARSGGRSQTARGDALMQDLAVAGRNVIPSRVGDSGTATRGAVTGLVAGAATGVPVAGALAVPVVATSIAYSRPAQAAINAIYRATDSQTAREGLEFLATLAQRDPALIPYYEASVQHVLSLGQSESPTIPQAQQSAPLPIQAR